MNERDYMFYQHDEKKLMNDTANDENISPQEQICLLNRLALGYAMRCNIERHGGDPERYRYGSVERSAWKQQV